MVSTEPKEIQQGLKRGSFPWSYDSRYRLWNLLEMLRLLAADWNEILRQLEILRNPLNTDIVVASIQGPKSKLLDPLRRIARICRSLELDFSARYAEEMIADIEAAPTVNEYFGAITEARAEASSAEQEVYNPFVPQKSKTLSPAEFGRRVEELKKHIDMQVEHVEFYIVEHSKRSYLLDPYLFGEEASNSFPPAVLDIEEAGKCFAFGRYTACVFHLMRVMEVGLRSLGRSLNDPNLDPAKNPTWERILRRCDDELKAEYAKRSVEWRADGHFFADATANLRAVKDAWRNPSLHIEISYDEEKAAEILSAVKAFMRHLATKLSE